MSGEGGSSASGAVDGMVSGDIWDAFQAAADEPEAAPGGSNGLFYTLPTVMDVFQLLSHTLRKELVMSHQQHGILFTQVLKV